ncbi:MAG: hypothetical protein IT319_07125 [Anaerolineae bacterium]|nr:hypothetical protein [Anaerolineae bacterium]
MDDLRKPVFVLALVLMLIVVLIEIGSGFALRGTPPGSPGEIMSSISGALPPELQDVIGDVDSDDVTDLADASTDIPGIAISYMALLDGLVLFTVGLVGSRLVLNAGVQSRVQGCGTLILSIFLILACIGLFFLALIALLIMVALLLAVPFGTIAYLAIYGFFNRGGAGGVLSILLFLKIGFAVCLVIAQQRFLQNRGLVLLVISSLVANIVISFLHGFVPIILVSITDAIGAIVMAVCGCIWWILALIGAIPAVLRALRPSPT